MMEANSEKTTSNVNMIKEEENIQDDRVEIKEEDLSGEEGEEKEKEEKEALPTAEVVAPPHPYAKELENFKPSPWQLEKKDPIPAKTFGETEFTVVDTKEKLDNMIFSVLSGQSRF